jgi:hypothetical protein
MALTVDWKTPSPTAISSCVLPSSRSALILAIRRSSTILDLGIVKLPAQHRSAALIATGWLCQEESLSIVTAYWEDRLFRRWNEGQITPLRSAPYSDVALRGGEEGGEFRRQQGARQAAHDWRVSPESALIGLSVIQRVNILCDRSQIGI